MIYSSSTAAAVPWGPVLKKYYVKKGRLRLCKKMERQLKPGNEIIRSMYKKKP